MTNRCPADNNETNATYEGLPICGECLQDDERFKLWIACTIGKLSNQIKVLRECEKGCNHANQD